MHNESRLLFLSFKFSSSTVSLSGFVSHFVPVLPTRLPPLDQQDLTSKVISVNLPFSAIWSSFSILVALPLGSALIPCSIKQDCTAAPTCPCAVPLPLQTHKSPPLQVQIPPSPLGREYRSGRAQPEAHDDSFIQRKNTLFVRSI